MLVIIVGLIVAAGLIIRLNTGSIHQDKQWKAELTSEINQDKKVMAAVGNGSARESLKKDIAINQYRIDHNLKPASGETLWGFVSGAAGNMVLVIAVFTIIVISGSIAGEFNSGTIKLLLIRPVYRTEILLSKYVSALLFTVFSLIILFITSWLVGGLLFGFSGATEAHLVYAHGAVRQTSWTLAVWQSYLLSCVSLVMTMTAAGMIAAIFRNSGLAIGISIFMMLAGPTITALLTRYDWVKYVLFANTDLSQYTDGTPLVKGMTLGFSLAVLAVYYLVFIAAGWLFFTRRDVAS